MSARAMSAEARQAMRAQLFRENVDGRVYFRVDAAGYNDAPVTVVRSVTGRFVCLTCNRNDCEHTGPAEVAYEEYAAQLAEKAKAGAS